MKRLLFLFMIILCSVSSYAQQDIKLKPFRIWYETSFGKADYVNPAAGSIMDIGTYGGKKAVYFDPFYKDSVALPRKGFFGYDITMNGLVYSDSSSWYKLVTLKDSNILATRSWVTTNFSASSHTHSISQVIGLQDSIDWNRSYAINRANHTGTQTASTISDFLAAAQAAVLEDAINDGEVGKAPTENAVYDALAAIPVGLDANTAIDSTSSHRLILGPVPSTVSLISKIRIFAGDTTSSGNGTGGNAVGGIFAGEYLRANNDSSSASIRGIQALALKKSTTTSGISGHYFWNHSNGGANGADFMAVDALVDLRGTGWVASAAGVSSGISIATTSEVTWATNFLACGTKRVTGTNVKNYTGLYIQERTSILQDGSLENRHGIFVDTLVAGDSNYGIYFSNVPNRGVIYGRDTLTLNSPVGTKLSDGKFWLATTELGSTSDSFLVKSGNEVKAIAPLSTLLSGYIPYSDTSASYFATRYYLSQNYASLTGSIHNGTSQQTSANFNIDGNGTIGGLLDLDSIRNTTTFTNQLFLGNSVSIRRLARDSRIGLTVNNSSTSTFAGHQGIPGVGNTLELIAGEGQRNTITILNTNASTGNNNTIRFMHNHHTTDYNTLTTTPNNTVIGALQFFTSNGVNIDGAVPVLISALTTEDHSSTNRGGGILISNIPNGTTTPDTMLFNKNRRTHFEDTVDVGKMFAANYLTSTLTKIDANHNLVAATYDDMLPTQTSNNGKFLTTNGTTASWATISLATVGVVFSGSTFSGDGVTTTFTVTHGLGSTPSMILVTPRSSSLNGISAYATNENSTTFDIVVSAAPAVGTNNVKFDWTVK